jgi:hypothetical protein
MRREGNFGSRPRRTDDVSAERRHSSRRESVGHRMRRTSRRKRLVDHTSTGHERGFAGRKCRQGARVLREVRASPGVCRQ